jgi:hypothetical protein
VARDRPVPQVLGLDHPERVPRRRLDPCAADLQRHHRAVVDGLSPALHDAKRRRPSRSVLAVSRPTSS